MVKNTMVFIAALMLTSAITQAGYSQNSGGFTVTTIALDAEQVGEVIEQAEIEKSRTEEAEAPKVETPEGEAPKVETPEGEAQKGETPKS